MNMEARLQRLERRLYRAELREIQDRFDLTDIEFKERYRLSPTLISDLIDILEPQIKRTRITGLSAEKQVLSAVRFYATGCFQRPVGEQWGIAMSQSSVSRRLHEVTDAIDDLIFRQWVQFPMTPQAREIAREVFFNAEQQFSGAMGAVDCTHIAICAPKNHEEAYINHHGYHSVNVQMICDPKLKILNVNARYPGAGHDAYIWASSAARRVMERAYNRGERRTYLIGDSGYPLEPWLLTPLPNEPEGTPRFAYNKAVCSARNCIERLFGVLKGTWRCLSKHRALQYQPGFAGRIVIAGAVLHNMRQVNGLLNDPILMVDEDRIENAGYIAAINNFNDNNNDENVRPFAVAQRIQDRLIAERFGA